MELGLIKVCGDPHCEAVHHNCPKELKKCLDCGGSIKMINEATFWAKYSNNYFQYDVNTQQYFRPQPPKILK